MGLLGPHTAPTLGEGHEERFLQAFDQYGDALFRHAFYRISDRERAIDLVHDTYVKVWQYARTNEAIRSYRALLYKTLNNLIIDAYRKRREVSLDALLEEDTGDERYLSALHEGSFDETAFALDAQRALKHLPALPDQYRQAIVLRFIDGLGPKEIAEICGTSENVISLRINRGLKYLKNLVS